VEAVVPQSAVFGLVQVHAPATQAAPVSQTTPQAPQLPQSVLVSVQVPPPVAGA
jgi:hypothetical protein